MINRQHQGTNVNCAQSTLLLVYVIDITYLLKLHHLLAYARCEQLQYVAVSMQLMDKIHKAPASPGMFKARLKVNDCYI